MKKIISHLDMDAFFASVEEVTTPRFLGKPIVVGSQIIGGVGRGVVSTANYKARAYGIHSAMPISIAWRLAQEAKNQGKEETIFLPVDFELYHKVSAGVLDIIKKYSDTVEQASIDEFYFDMSAVKTFARAKSICQKIKAEIKNTQKITCSVGIGPNKLVAKIAAGIKKPDGLYLVPPKNVQEFLNPLAIRELPDIGPKTAEFFYKKNIRTIADLQTFSKDQLTGMLGKHGESIFTKARGIDDSPITQLRQVKSMGEQTTFDVNTSEPVVIFGMVKKLSDSVFASFSGSDFNHFKTMTITVRFADFETKTSSKSVKEGIGKTEKKKFEIEITKLLLPFLDARGNPRGKPLRLVGVRIEKLSE